MANSDRAQIKTKVIAIIAEKLNIDKDKVAENSTLQELGADSLDIVEIIMKLEEVFGIEINDEDAENLHDVGQVIEYVHRLQKD